jgi:hypothetical protein
VDSEPRFDLVEIFHYPARAACDERAFVLHAVGIGSQVAFTGRHWSLFVDAADTPNAATHLVRYEHENPPRRRFIRPEGTHAWAWIGAASYAAVLLGVAYLAGHRAFAANWLAAGSLTWRLFAVVNGGARCALICISTLHTCCQPRFRRRVPWPVALLRARCGARRSSPRAREAVTRTCRATMCRPAHRPRCLQRSACCRVFVAGGRHDGGRWAYRWAPAIAGVCMLAFTGAAGGTDVLAHLTGFVVGGGFGVTLAARQRHSGQPRPARRQGPRQPSQGMVCRVAMTLRRTTRPARRRPPR